MSVVVDIRKHFSGFDLQMAFEAGNETMGLLGESGCGKSVSLRSIAGIETPDEGKIEVNGKLFFDRVKGHHPTVNLTPQERKTALLFQNYMLFPNLTVWDNVAAGIAKDTPKDERNAIIANELTRFSVDHLAKRYPAQLSGGQQQRVALARMLAAKPGILMLDEPFSALDSHLKSVLEQNLVSLFDEFEGSILYVSHDIDEALRFCDRIAVVNAGHIMEIDSGDELFHHPHSEAAIKLSGCKNIPDAVYVDDHTVDLVPWGVQLRCADTVPQDVKKVGIREIYIERAAGPGDNCYQVRVDRVSDSRYDWTVLLSFVGNPRDDVNPAHIVDEMAYLSHRAFWRVDKLTTAMHDLPREGDVLWIHIPEDHLHVVTK